MIALIAKIVAILWLVLACSCLFGSIVAMRLFHDLRDERARDRADGEDAGRAGLDHDLDHISGAQRDHA